MGCYLTKPITKKESEDETYENVTYGSSSMQGWRTFQEDAHNAILKFDEDLSFFAVYDGHGGEEVAAYTARNFPDYLNKKMTENIDFEDVLNKTFLEFDSRLLEPAILEEIQALSKSTDTSEQYEEELEALHAEAVMPIEKLVEKYNDKILMSSNSSSTEDSSKPCSSGLISLVESKKKNHSLKGKSSSSSQVDNLEDANSSSKENIATSICNEQDKLNNGEECDKDFINSEVSKTADSVMNGDENNEELQKDKGPGDSKEKNIMSVHEIEETKKLQRSKLRKAVLRQAASFYQKVQDSDDELSDDTDDSEDDSDVQIEEEEECSDDVDEETSDEEDNVDEEDNIDEGQNVYSEFLQENKEEPCYDSGCTACVALLKKNMLYVANVGDSRCVLYREGVAIDMSVDHKPEDIPELTRITKAGGKITEDGRVNGGLNLSRALGDHRYKQNKSLKPEEQMISPQPDIKSLELSHKDAFMVIACDGIWNSLSSQEVCEYIERFIKQKCKLSTICEQLFDVCLAPDAQGDGTGCDNMTCIIVQFNFAKDSKRKLENSNEEKNENVSDYSKKPKLEL